MTKNNFRKKILFLAFAFVFLTNFVYAANLNVERTDARDVLIKGINEPAVFDLKVTNLDGGDNFQFYNLLGFSMSPKGTVQISQGETKDVEMMIYPREDMDFKGLYTFEYFIQGSNGDKQLERETVRIMELKDAFEIGSGDVSPETSSINIYISNSANFKFEDAKVEFSSPFFEVNKEVSLNPYEKKEFAVELKKDDFQKLTAGFYTLNAKINYKGVEASEEGVIKFVEGNKISATENDYGFVINTRTIEKKNEGNILATAETTVRKNIISRLFTTFNPEPDSVSRQGASVYYSWKKELKPGEALNVSARTNWLFPLMVILFIIAIVILAKQYARTNLVLRKRVSFVNAKGGEFALKVSIVAAAKNHIERVNVVDRLPSLVKLYEKFGGERPVRINESARRIEWDLGNMEKGEKRILSYIIYSKVGVMGKFSLPEATAIYEKDGDVKETASNRAFFVAEQRKKDLED
ncbi:hypothetical protein HY449_01145 [Candidatus Pacearchaeota archaeon]|nr:hypothetical protein [Candidatus Pacearchaeota archaeon]